MRGGGFKTETKLKTEKEQKVGRFNQRHGGLSWGGTPKTRGGGEKARRNQEEAEATKRRAEGATSREKKECTTVIH